MNTQPLKDLADRWKSVAEKSKTQAAEYAAQGMTKLAHAEHAVSTALTVASSQLRDEIEKLEATVQ